MINIIGLASRNVSLLKNIQFLFHRKPRPQEAPTQRPTLEPFSINYLRDNPGAKYSPKLLGRGPGSNKGKTSARGMKGHWSRSGGGPHVRFEGGQTPIQKRLPKYGRVIRKRPIETYNYVNLETIDYYVKQGILNPNQTITVKTLMDTGIIKKLQFGVKILGRGADRITYPLNFEVSDASKTAINYVTKQGGSINLVFRTTLKLKEHVYPNKYPIPLLEPIPPFWRVEKLQRKELDRGIPISFTKPKWLIENEKKASEQKEKRASEQKEKKIEKEPFIFPVPIVENSGKIRKRKTPVYKQINYHLP